MDCYYHGYSGGPGGECSGCQRKDNRHDDGLGYSGRPSRVEKARAVIRHQPDHSCDGDRIDPGCIVAGTLQIPGRN